MNEHSGFTTGHLALAFLAGAAAGAITALLTAPKSGRENREALRHFAEDSKQRAAMGVGRVLDRAERAARAAKESFVDHPSSPEVRGNA